MGKLKLTEQQISMLQSLEDQLPKKKIVKITTEQYNRVFQTTLTEGFQAVGRTPNGEPVSDVGIYKNIKGFYSSYENLVGGKSIRWEFRDYSKFILCFINVN